MSPGINRVASEIVFVIRVFVAFLFLNIWFVLVSHCPSKCGDTLYLSHVVSTVIVAINMFPSGRICCIGGYRCRFPFDRGQVTRMDLTLGVRNVKHRTPWRLLTLKDSVSSFCGFAFPPAQAHTPVHVAPASVACWLKH